MFERNFLIWQNCEQVTRRMLQPMRRSLRASLGPMTLESWPRARIVATATRPTRPSYRNRIASSSIGSTTTLATWPRNASSNRVPDVFWLLPV